MSPTTTTTTAPSPREILVRLHQLTVTDEAAAVDLYAENAVHEIPFAPAGAQPASRGEKPSAR